jgi:pimeloyl-ACP methyl ester carboxylesterase
VRVLAWWLGGVALLYAGACVALFLLQRSLLYFPQPRAFASAETTASLAVNGADLVLTVRRLAGAPAVVYFGGNAEDVSRSLPGLARVFPDHALYLMHYRGYGGSSGAPSEAALHADAAALFDQVRKEHDEVVVVGRSLGSGVAVRLASQRPVARLVLVTPYDSIQALAAAQFPIFPVRWLLRDPFDSAARAAQIEVPTTLVVAERDEIIPEASSRRLYERFRPGVARYRVIRGAGHNDISEHTEYASALRP